MDLRKMFPLFGMIAFVVGAIAMVAGILVGSTVLQYTSIMAWLLWVGCGGVHVEMR